MITPSPEFLKVFKETNGALSVCESIAIMNIASEALEGVYLEMGTFKGKSAMSAAEGLKRGSFCLLEPLIDGFTDEEKREIISKVYREERLHVVLLPTYSIAFLEFGSQEYKEQNKYSFVFLDAGNHQDGLPMQEVKLLEDRIVKDGIIAFHDYQSQFKEVEEAYNYLISTGKYEPIHIAWPEIVQYVKDNDLERGNSSWHHNELEFPCFVGAVKRL